MSQVPKGKTLTYGQIVVNHTPHKKEQNRTRLTVGGNLINYSGDVSTPTADLATIKILFNSVISTANGFFMTADIKKLLSEYTTKRIRVHETTHGTHT